MLINPYDPRLLELDELDTSCRVTGSKPVVQARSLSIDGRIFRHPHWATHVTVDNQGIIRACTGTPLERPDGSWNYQAHRVEYLGTTSVKSARKIRVSAV